MSAARCSMSTARLPDEQFRMIEAGEVGADVAGANFTFAGAAEAPHRVPGLLPAVHVMRTSLRSWTYSSTWSAAGALADSAARRLTTAVRRSGARSSARPSRSRLPGPRRGRPVVTSHGSAERVTAPALTTWSRTPEPGKDVRRKPQCPVNRTVLSR